MNKYLNSFFSKRNITLIVFVSLFLFPTVYTMALEVPPLTGRVVDKANILSLEETKGVEKAIIKLEENTDGQMAVLIIKSLESESLENYSIRVAEKWKIGYSGKDNGLILLIAMREHKIRIEVGYGWESKVTDAKAGDIIRAMQVFFREKKYALGILIAVSKVDNYLIGKTIPVDKKFQDTKVDDNYDFFGRFFFFALAVCFGLGIRWCFGKVFGAITVSCGGSSGGGFSGGGGSFGGGGASGGW